MSDRYQDGYVQGHKRGMEDWENTRAENERLKKLLRWRCCRAAVCYNEDSGVECAALREQDNERAEDDSQSSPAHVP